ncbi:MAG: RluA family pseudouridine synthase [Holosporales bacterium]|nr:RluA family pseudouridine synthase [Holosporales bacterium]
MNLQISDEYVGKRLDTIIAELTDGLSRSQIQKLIKNGKVFIDGLKIQDSSRKVLKSCYVAMENEELENEYEIIPENIELDILFEDEFIVILNKPAGMVCHPAPGHKSGTLVNAIKYHFINSLSDISGKFRPGIVHRIDKDTSGLMLIAKTNEAHFAFSALFSSEKGKSMRRKYICFVFGVPFEKAGKIQTFIIRNPKNRQTYTVCETNGKTSTTLYEVEKSVYFTPTKGISRINCELLTGRTHQIRVHMQYIKHHIIGDQVYAKSKIEKTYPELIRSFARQALHAKELSFLHPFTKENLVFNSEIPEDMKLLNNLFKSS